MAMVPGVLACEPARLGTDAGDSCLASAVAFVRVSAHSAPCCEERPFLFELLSLSAAHRQGASICHPKWLGQPERLLQPKFLAAPTGRSGPLSRFAVVISTRPFRQIQVALAGFASLACWQLKATRARRIEKSVADSAVDLRVQTRLSTLCHPSPPFPPRRLQHQCLRLQYL